MDRGEKNKTSKATNVCPPSLRKEREDRGGKARDREREREIKKERDRERDREGSGRGRQGVGRGLAKLYSAV